MGALFSRNRSYDDESDLEIDESEVDHELKVMRMTMNSIIPTRGSKLAAGVDLYASESATIEPRSKGIISTGISVQLPPGTYGRIAPRSGLAAKNDIDVGAGVIDRDFRGCLSVILFNHGDAPLEVNVGDRIAQLICEKCLYADVVEVDELDESERGAGGFGSTGR
jgi:dUTP pyrophosphatase